MSEVAGLPATVAAAPALPKMIEHLDRPKIELLKSTIAVGASDDELKLFVHVCERTRLDPFAGQIYAIKRWDSQAQREKMSIQVGIHGFRLVADRTGQMDGREGPFWCGGDGVWKDIWLANEPPVAAKCTIYRKGVAHPFTAICLLKEYCQRKKDGRPTQLWEKMPALMIGKCAEAQALRAAFPLELAGLHEPAEIGDRDEPAPQNRQQQQRQQQAPALTRPATAQTDGARIPPPSDGSLNKQLPDEPLTKKQLGQLRAKFADRHNYEQALVLLLGVSKLDDVPYKWLNGIGLIYKQLPTSEALHNFARDQLGGCAINDLDEDELAACWRALENPAPAQEPD